jgi:hypothetical protein
MDRNTSPHRNHQSEIISITTTCCLDIIPVSLFQRRGPKSRADRHISSSASLYVQNSRNFDIYLDHGDSKCDETGVIFLALNDLHGTRFRDKVQSDFVIGRGSSSSGILRIILQNCESANVHNSVAVGPPECIRFVSLDTIVSAALRTRLCDVQPQRKVETATSCSIRRRTRVALTLPTPATASTTVVNVMNSAVLRAGCRTVSVHRYRILSYLGNHFYFH